MTVSQTRAIAGEGVRNSQIIYFESGVNKISCEIRCDV